MKKLYIYTIISAVILAMTACTQREDVKIPNPTVRVSLTAITEGGNDTKALMGEENADRSRSILWEPGDSIRITSPNYQEGTENNAFVNRSSENDRVATFEGELNPDIYEMLATYPYSMYVSRYYNEYWNGNNWVYENFFMVNLPKTQTYRENNFAKEAFPMAAYKSTAQTKVYESLINSEMGPLEFKNLCGVLALNIVGDITVKSITMSATDSSGNAVALSGMGQIGKDSLYHQLQMAPVNTSGTPIAYEGYSTVTLECPEGVQLDPDIPTPFHIVLPPATYSSFSLTITASDGRIMLVNVDKELVINRSKARHTAPLTYIETIAVNLSERGTSNCYIVEKAGIYTFDASVIGNGAIGIKPYANFHTSDPAISPASVELLWEDTNGLISALNYDSEEKKVSFMHSGIEGNALIAVKDEEGVILWSWHIWCTDKPALHTYKNYQKQTFSVQDRNLGATRADKGTGEEWKESVGLHYQWGRKDPFTFGNLHSDNTLTIDQTIQNPTRTGPWRWMNESTHYYNTYMNLWSDSLKTVYDPCPVGYKVAPNAIWTGFSKNGLSTYGGSVNFKDYNVSGSFDHGWNFIYDGSNTAWYPITCSDSHNVTDWYGDNGEYWSSTYSSTNESYRLYFRYTDDFSCELNMNSSASGYIKTVRCVTDEGYIDTSLPTLSTPVVTNIGNTTATFGAEAITQGGSAVIQKGFVWSKSHKPTIDLDTKIIVSSDTGKYSADVSKLEQMSGYYVRAFATNSHGTGYGEEIFFSTKYDGIPNNLSNNGTSNCYIVSEEGYFSFDASVIGNGAKGIIPDAGFHTSDPAISPVSTEILWMDTDDVITYIYFDEAKKSINFWASGKEGNALIAAKDGDGNIVWSWHIWSTDKPADHSYFNHNMKNFIVMDRNIGAIRADRGTGEEWRESAGLFYQWGRKDPFSPNRYNYIYYTTSLKESISHPNTMVVLEGGNWCNNSINSNWNEEQKTIYDPCPLGYRISPSDTWSAFSKTGQYANQLTQFNVSGSWDYGFNFIYDGTNTAWFPQTYIGYYGETETGIGEYWLPSSNGNSGRKFGYNTNGVQLFFDWYEHTSRGHAVRCVKDQVYNDPSMPNVLTTSVTNITESQAKLTGEVTSEGTYGVTEKGFVWNVNAEGKTLNVDTANKDIVGSGMGSFETTLITLKPGTNYFFRSYAISANGTVYGEIIYFKTKETGSNEDLGEDEHEW